MIELPEKLIGFLTLVEAKYEIKEAVPMGCPESQWLRFIRVQKWISMYGGTLQNEWDEYRCDLTALKVQATVVDAVSKHPAVLEAFEQHREQPLKITYSKEELQAELTQWMVEQWGRPKDLEPERQDVWFERNGLINQFILHLFK